MKQLKRWSLLIFAFTFSLFLFACGEELPDLSENAESEAAATKELDIDSLGDDVLIIGMSNAPSSQNPFFAQGASEQWAMKFFYETLLNQTSATEFVPRLGEFETEDNQTFTVRLDPAAHWTDGEPVVAEDVAFTLNTIAHPDTLTSMAAKIGMLEGTDDAGKMAEGMEELPGVQVIDEHTLELTTKEPVDINYISEFLGTGVIIAPEHVFGDIPKAELHTSEPATNPSVFNGAYEFVEYQDENYLHMTANEDYYRGAPKIKDIYIRVLSNEAMVTELQAGSIDMISQGGFGDIPHHNIPLVEAEENLVVEKGASPNVQYLVINHEDPRFEDVRVRQAFAHAIDFEMSVENLLLGNGETLPASYYSENSYQDESLEPYPYDPEKAKELLEEADFDFSQPVELGVPTGNTIREQNADLVQQGLEALGLEVVQTQYDFTTWMSFLRDGDFDIGMYGMGHDYDPDITAFVGTGGASNHANYSSEEMDALLVAGIEEVDPELRYPIYQEVQELFKEDLPAIPLYSEAVYSVQNKNLKGGIQAFHPASLVDLHEWEFVE